MTPLAIAIIAYVGGALTVVAALVIGAAARDYPAPRIQPPSREGYLRVIRDLEHDPRLN